MSTELAFSSKAGNKAPRYLPYKVKSYMLSAWWPWHLILCAITVWASIKFTTGYDWSHGEEGDPTLKGLAFIVWSFALGIFSTLAAAIQGGEVSSNYRYRLRDKQQETLRQSIEAEVDERSGAILIYEINESITGSSKTMLKKFDDPDDDDIIHAYVSNEKQRLAGPDLSKAKAIAKVINEG